MKLKIETWSIAYRKKKTGLLFEDCNDFRVIENGNKGWYADPFLYDYDGETYLFAEYYSYSLGRGVISYAKYDKEADRFGSFNVIIQEDFHMSYPLIFKKDDGALYMMPEVNQSGTLYLYKAVHFPDKWERVGPVIEEKIRLADTTPIRIDGTVYALSYKINEGKENELILLKEKNGIFAAEKILGNDNSLIRPGGYFFKYDEKLIRVSQDCEKGYGYGLNLIEVSEDFENYREKLIKKIYPSQIGLLNGKEPSGVHTYTFSNDLEVIDLKYYRRSYYRIFKSILRKLTAGKSI